MGYDDVYLFENDAEALKYCESMADCLLLSQKKECSQCQRKELIKELMNEVSCVTKTNKKKTCVEKKKQDDFLKECVRWLNMYVIGKKELEVDI